MEKQVVYMMSLDATLEGKYYDIITSEDYLEAEQNFLEYCEKRNLSDDIEVQYIDGCLSGKATDYIKEMLELSEEFGEDLEVVGEIFNSIYNIDETRRCLENRNYSIYPNELYGRFQTKEDAFQSYIEDIDFLYNVPENIKPYIDYDKIMRDFEIEGLQMNTYHKGYIFINHY